MTAVEELRELVARGIAAQEGRPDDWPGMGGLADERIAAAGDELRARVTALADDWDRGKSVGLIRQVVGDRLRAALEGRTP